MSDAEQIKRLKIEIALLRMAILAQAPVGGLNDARHLLEQADRTAARMDIPETEDPQLRRVTAAEWSRMSAMERARAYVE